jgi:hypothetical protein
VEGALGGGDHPRALHRDAGLPDHAPRPGGATPEERAALDEASRDFVQRYSPDSSATQLQTLSDLHDRGKLTDAEFAAEKARVLGTSGPATEAQEPPAAPAAPQPS